jgi:hypothetical protein
VALVDLRERGDDAVAQPEVTSERGRLCALRRREARTGRRRGECSRDRSHATRGRLRSAEPNRAGDDGGLPRTIDTLERTDDIVIIASDDRGGFVRPCGATNVPEKRRVVDVARRDATTLCEVRRHEARPRDGLERCSNREVGRERQASEDVGEPHSERTRPTSHSVCTACSSRTLSSTEALKRDASTVRYTFGITNRTRREATGPVLRSRPANRGR